MEQGDMTFSISAPRNYLKVKIKTILEQVALQQDKIFSAIVFLDTIFLTINFMPHMPQQL